MVVAVLTGLIDKLDSFEIVRNRVTEIIKANQAAQVILAAAVPKPNPEDWKLRVFQERSNPWEQFRDAPKDTPPDKSPVVNVWYDNGSFDKSVGDPVRIQNQVAVINVDVYGWGIASGDGGTGQIPGDESASLTCQRGVRLVRNILMAAENTYLQLRPKPESDGNPKVWSRWIDSISLFQPQLGDNSAHQVIAARIALSVSFNEFSQQVDASNDLEEVRVDINEAGGLTPVAEADFTYPIT